MLRDQFTCSLQLTVDMQISRSLKLPAAAFAIDYLFAYLTMAWLPEGWEFKTEKASDGSTVMFYYNAETKQEFFSDEDMMRYANYVKNTAPHLRGFDEATRLHIEGLQLDQELRDFMKATHGKRQSGNVSDTDAVEAGKKFRKLENRPAKKRKEA